MHINNRSRGLRASRALTLAVGLALVVPSLAQAAPVGPGGASDPFERVNRVMFGIHQFIDHALLRPAAMTYRRIMPRPVRTVLKNAISNLGEPAIAVNDLLQGHGIKAARTLTRFATNTTFGVAGLFDVATPADLPHHDNDFGLTLARYGIKAGPYLFVPLVGPLTLRDGIGDAAGLGLNPLVYTRYPGDEQVGFTSLVAGGLQTRADADSDLKALFATATDPYASMRSFYLQSRYATISGGKLDVQSLPDFGDEPAAPASAVAPPPPAEAPVAPPAPAPQAESTAGDTDAAPATEADAARADAAS